MHYRIITYGCQMNERDTEAIAAMLQDLGYQPAGPGQQEDLVIFNTCCVRDNAERKAIGKVLEYKAAKTDRPDLLVGVGGCLPQQPGAAARLAQRAPWLDFIYGTQNLDRLPVLVAMARTRGMLRHESGGEPTGPVVEILDEPLDVTRAQPRAAVEPRPVGHPRRIEAYVSISHGCDNRCSYCIVPAVRGPERSRPVDLILDEIACLARSGIREVTLLGQNVNSYGGDLGGGPDFPSLLAQVDRLAPEVGLLRIRFTTSHPKDLSSRLIAALAELPTVCEHIHLPVQSGSDRVLKLMNRGYDRRRYLGLIQDLRRAVPAVGLTTDVIVGFPGETEADFTQTLELVAEAAFDSAFTFAFSPRGGTAAASLPGEVPLEVRRERLARLNRLQEEISRSRRATLHGTRQEVLFSGPSAKDPAILGGRTRGFHYVLVPGPSALTGTLGQVEITATRTWTLSGVLREAAHAASAEVGGR